MIWLAFQSSTAMNRSTLFILSFIPKLEYAKVFTFYTVYFLYLLTHSIIIPFIS